MMLMRVMHHAWVVLADINKNPQYFQPINSEPAELILFMFMVLQLGPTNVFLCRWSYTVIYLSKKYYTVLLMSKKYFPLNLSSLLYFFF